MKRFLISLAVCCLCLMGARGAGAQTPRDGRLLATVIDPSKAVIMGATVTVTGAEDATKGVTIAPVKTVEMGLATIEGLRPGRYTVQAEFPGFQTTVLKDVRIRAGDNKHLIVLPLKNVEDSVTVGRDAQAAAAERRSLGSALTREQIELLSDDPDEMDRQLKELAGMNATIRVDSFEGNQLPPKSQIKSIHITRDQYAAESHYVGHTFVDIITQPGMGPLRGNMGFNFRDGSMSGRNQFTQQRGPEQYRRFNAGFGGTIAKQRTSFSINMNGSNTYDTPNLFVSLPGGTRSETLNIRVPRESYGIGGYLDHALTRDQTLRVNVNMNRGENRNLGIGAYDLPERGYSTKSRGYSLMVQEAGPLGRRFFINTRLSVRMSDTESRSFLEAPTIRVTDGFNAGGAQRAGGSHNRTFTLQSDLDYIRGIHSWRTGIQVDGAWIRTDDTSNYLGTYTFTSVEAFEAGLPTFYTRRLGDPLIRYSNFQVGMYVQDDIRVSKTLTLSPGLRYEAQTHVRDYNGLAPRFGVTWSPFKSGKTSIRAGGGVFYDWLSTGTYAQTLRVDGFRQQELTIVNPTFPDPGSFGTVRATNRYLLGRDLQLIRNVGYSAGVDQRFSPRIFVGINYSATRSAHILRGRNLNLPVNGTRPDPAFANVIETVADASGRRHSVNVHSSFNFLAPSPTASRARFNWRRFSMFGFYSYNDGRNNSDGAFSFPASGTIDTEWGPEGSPKHNLNWSINSSALRNLNVNFGYFGYSGSAYTITTGFDENGDLLFNDRPVGVGRNTERVPNWYQQWSARIAYTIGFGRAVGPGGPGPIMIGDGRIISGPGGAPGAPRYRINIGLSVQNLTNRANLSGYSGVMTSKFFRTATNAGMPRKVDLNVSFSF